MQHFKRSQKMYFSSIFLSENPSLFLSPEVSNLYALRAVWHVSFYTPQPCRKNNSKSQAELKNGPGHDHALRALYLY